MKCSGIDVFTGAAVEVTGGAAIDGVDHLITTPPGMPDVAPGFIDMQVNGFGGVDHCSPDAPAEQIGRTIREMFATGVTRFFPTVITGTAANMAAALRNLAEAKESIPEGPAMEGFHVEGPHISPEDGPRGAHPKHCVRPPDFEEFKRWQEAARGNVKLVTVSPEWPGTPSYIEQVVREGVVASIGHTKASAEQIQAAVSAGATMSTHLGNGAHAVMARHPNYIWEQMAEDRLAAGFIVDGIHLGGAFLTVAMRAKGVERAVLVTDAAMPTGCQPGPYMLGEVEVTLHPDGSVRLREGDRLAGSALMMNRAVGNVMRLAGVSLREAVTMATVNPARVGRVASRHRGLATGQRADVVVFDLVEGAVKVRETWMSGECVYRA